MAFGGDVGIFAILPETHVLTAKFLFSHGLLGAATLPIAALLTSCAPSTRWVHPTVPQSEWRLDRLACTKAAEKKARGRLEDSLAFPTYGTGDTPNIIDRAALMRYEKFDTKTLTAQCLQSLGYRKQRL